MLRLLALPHVGPARCCHRGFPGRVEWGDVEIIGNEVMMVLDKGGRGLFDEAIGDAAGERPAFDEMQWWPWKGTVWYD